MLYPLPDLSGLYESIIMADDKRNGRKLKTLREKLGITQKDFADVLEVHPRSVRKWENGERIPSLTLPQVAALFALLKKADMTVDQLLDCDGGLGCF